MRYVPSPHVPVAAQSYLRNGLLKSFTSASIGNKSYSTWEDLGAVIEKILSEKGPPTIEKLWKPKNDMLEKLRKAKEMEQRND